MATVRLVLDKQRVKNDGTYPIKIRVAHGVHHKPIGTSISLTEVEFEKMMKGKNLSDDLKKTKKKLDALIAKGNEIIEKLDPFNFASFINKFQRKGNRSDLIFLLRDKAARFAADEKYGSENLYKQTANMLYDFINRGNTSNPIEILPVNQVDPIWLKSLEKWALTTMVEVKKKEGKVIEPRFNQTTLGMYLIRVRSIFNDIISAKEVSPDAYPFHRADNKNGYKIPQPINNKRPLEMAKIMEFYEYQPANEGEQMCKDFFLFSYLASGMNMVDIFRLKWSDIKQNQFSFVRKKNESKPGGQNKISIPLNEDLIEIIERQGSRKINNDYIFNIIPAGATEKQLLAKTRSAIAKINLNIKLIAEKLGWEEDPSTYFARHAYSNNLMNSEVPLAFISKQLGHKSLKTTQNYLDSFTSDNAIKYQENLLKKTK